MNSEDIVIVNEGDECIGTMSKLLTHQLGILHRAFSVVLFGHDNNMLIQKRSKTKYHSASLWANACCSHQLAGESLEDSLHRRIMEELGIQGIALQEAFILRYRCEMPNKLIENEIDHVFYGWIEDIPRGFSRDEIEQVTWISLDELKENAITSDRYAYWFRLILDRIFQAGCSCQIITPQRV